MARFGVWSSWSKTWCFGIIAPSAKAARKALFNKIGDDARKWRFEFLDIDKHEAKLARNRKRRPDKMTTGQLQTAVTTGEVRLTFVNLFTPRAQQPGQEPKYSATILIPKHDTATMQRIYAAIQAAVQKDAAGAWPGQKPAQPRTPIHDGDGVRPSGEPFGPECKGHWVMTASSKQPQQVVDAGMSPIIDQTKVYSGVYGRVSINFFSYSNSGNKGIGAGLGPVQILRDGEPLGGRITAEQAFGGAPASAGYQQQSHMRPQGGEQAAPQQQWQQPAPQQHNPYVQQQPMQQPAAHPQQHSPYVQQPPQQQQPTGPQVGQQIDPITGKPVVGNILGL